LCLSGWWFGKPFVSFHEKKNTCCKRLKRHLTFYLQFYAIFSQPWQKGEFWFRKRSKIMTELFSILSQSLKLIAFLPTSWLTFLPRQCYKMSKFSFVQQSWNDFGSSVELTSGSLKGFFLQNKNRYKKCVDDIHRCVVSPQPSPGGANHSTIVIT